MKLEAVPPREGNVRDIQVVPPADGGGGEPNIAFYEERWLHKAWQGVLEVAVRALVSDIVVCAGCVPGVMSEPCNCAGERDGVCCWPRSRTVGEILLKKVELDICEAAD